MKIPDKFKTILESSQLLNSIVLDVLSSFEPVFRDNKLYFFEEYTDHGIDHIEKVLESAAFVITDESYKDLTPSEVAILVLSIILHDLGMHTELSNIQSNVTR